MKICYLSALLIALWCSSTQVVGQSNVIDTTTELATVYVYRSGKLLSSARKYWVYANNKPICKLSNNRHCQITLPTGPVTFTTKLAGLTLVPKKRLSLSIMLDAGKTYYLQGDLKTTLLPLQAVLPLTEVVPNATKLKEINQSKAEPVFVNSVR